MMRKICSKCKGRRYIMGLGYMKKPCLACKEVGWIEVDEPIVEAPTKPTVEETVRELSEQAVKPKRRGRPPRIKTEGE